MRSKLLFVYIVFVLLVVGCRSLNDTPASNINEKLEEKIVELENVNKKQRENNEKLKSQLEECNRELDKFKQSHKYFSLLSYKATNFIEAYINKDLDYLKKLAADNIKITNDYIYYNLKGEKIIIPYPKSKFEIEYKLNSFSYEQETEAVKFYYFLWEQETNQSKGFIILWFKKFNDNWKIVMIETDV